MKKCKSRRNYYKPNSPDEGANEKCNKCYQRDGKSINTDLNLLLIGIIFFLLPINLKAETSTLSYAESIESLSNIKKYKSQSDTQRSYIIILLNRVPDSLKNVVRYIAVVEYNLPFTLFATESLTAKMVWFQENLIEKPTAATLIGLEHINLLKNKTDTTQTNTQFIDSLVQMQQNESELLANYYNRFFSRTVDRYRLTSELTMNFDLTKLNLNTNKEKSIFVLTYINACHSHIFGFMNIAKPPNYKATHEILNTYNTINNLNYYQFKDFDFEDFDVTIETDKPKESFKAYYIGIYYNTLMYHYLCLNKKKKYKHEKIFLVENSILSQQDYREYCKSRQFLKSINQNYKN